MLQIRKSILVLTAFFLIPGTISARSFTRRRSFWKKLYAYARLADQAYFNNRKKIARITGARYIRTYHLRRSHLRYILVRNRKKKMQYVLVRGTKNVRNFFVDIRYLKRKDRRLGVYLHTGFRNSGRELFNHIRRRLKRGYRTVLIGHSLGGAAALVLAFHLRISRFPIRSVVTFGQPKVGNRKCARKFRGINVLRVANKNDFVTKIPPTTLLASIHGKYMHQGAALMLYSRGRFRYMRPGAATRSKEFQFFRSWSKVQPHRMGNYIKRIKYILYKRRYR